jgi:hypothetical protein
LPPLQTNLDLLPAISCIGGPENRPCIANGNPIGRGAEMNGKKNCRGSGILMISGWPRSRVFKTTPESPQA